MRLNLVRFGLPTFQHQLLLFQQQEYLPLPPRRPCASQERGAVAIGLAIASPFSGCHLLFFFAGFVFKKIFIIGFICFVESVDQL
ncbi:MAG: hypothetical protein ACK50M_11370, partial [Cyclobacteriaceae bacterium]